MIVLRAIVFFLFFAGMSVAYAAQSVNQTTGDCSPIVNGNGNKVRNCDEQLGERKHTPVMVGMFVGLVIEGNPVTIEYSITDGRYEGETEVINGFNINRPTRAVKDVLDLEFYLIASNGVRMVHKASDIEFFAEDDAYRSRDIKLKEFPQRMISCIFYGLPEQPGSFEYSLEKIRLERPHKIYETGYTVVMDSVTVVAKSGDDCGSLASKFQAGLLAH